MKRAIFVSVGTVVGLTATLRYTPHAESIGGTNLALGGLSGNGDPSASPTAPVNQDAATPVPSVSASMSASASPSATVAKSATPSQSAKASATPKATQHTVAKSTPKATHKATPTPKATHKATPTPASNSGVFTGSAVTVSQGRTQYGVIQVQVEVASGKITKIGFLQIPQNDPRSSEISQTYIPVMRDEALAAQSSKIANVSGATHTTEGFAQSLASALAKAGL